LAPVPSPGAGAGEPADVVARHIDAAVAALESLRSASAQLAAWGAVLAERLVAGHRLLTAGNGGSAAEAQHLTAELVGRFDGEREPFSAIALHAESSAFTAIANDYGVEEVFARQVHAHGRTGDVLMLFSTSGRSPNLLRAAAVARASGLLTWSLTGVAPNPLADATDETVAIDAGSASAQECHLVAVHALCRAFDRRAAELRDDPPIGEGRR
jgi:D-sedoheptulose 7-phosphate isomerase